MTCPDFLLLCTQVLCLGKEGKDCTDVHVVEAGDGCWAIYTGAGIPAETFFANNPNVARTCHNIYPGEVSRVD